MDQSVAPAHRALVQRLLERIECEIGTERVRDPPTDDPPGKGVDDEGGVNEPGPGPDKREIGNPQRVRSRRLEHSINSIRRRRPRCRRDRCLHPPAPYHATQAKLAHQPRHRAAGDRKPLAAKLAPDLANAVHPEVLLPHPAYVLAPLRVPPDTGRPAAAVRFPGLDFVIRRRGDRQHPADRLTPYAARSASMNNVMAYLGGRAPPGQNRLTPCAGSRSPAATRGSPAPAP